MCYYNKYDKWATANKSYIMWYTCNISVAFCCITHVIHVLVIHCRTPVTHVFYTCNTCAIQLQTNKLWTTVDVASNCLTSSVEGVTSHD